MSLKGSHTEQNGYPTPQLGCVYKPQVGRYFARPQGQAGQMKGQGEQINLEGGIIEKSGIQRKRPDVRYLQGRKKNTGLIGMINPGQPVIEIPGS